MATVREAGMLGHDVLVPAEPTAGVHGPGCAEAAAIEPAPSGSRLRRGLVAVDVVAVTAGWALAVAITDAGTGAVLSNAAFVVVVGTGTLGALAQQQLYRARIASVRADELVRIARAGLASAVLALVTLGALGGELKVRTFALAYAVVVTAIALARGQFAGWLRRQRTIGRHLQPVVVLGDGDDADELVSLLLECPEVGFRPVGVVGRRPASGDVGVPWLGSLEDVVAIVERSDATGVLIASGTFDAAFLNRVVRQLHARGVHVHLSSGLAHLHRRRLRVQAIAHEPLIYVEPRSLSAGQLIAKRIFDVVVATVVLVAVSPVLTAAALAVRLSDGGPVFFRQRRVGRDGLPFRIWKFRTMTVDAEQRLAELVAGNEREGPLFKVTDDPRVTRVGRLLRDTSIDELPQLFNVLRGDMSMVGPRPALPEEVEQFDEELLDRLRVKPGVSGLWQVEARDKASFRLYRRLDLFYVENWSLALDVSVLLATVPSVLRRGWAAVASRSGPATAWSPALTTEEP